MLSDKAHYPGAIHTALDVWSHTNDPFSKFFKKLPIKVLSDAFEVETVCRLFMQAWIWSSTSPFFAFLGIGKVKVCHSMLWRLVSESSRKWGSYSSKSKYSTHLSFPMYFWSSFDYLLSENALKHRKNWALKKTLCMPAKVSQEFPFRKDPKSEAKPDSWKLMSLIYKHNGINNRYKQLNDWSEVKLLLKADDNFLCSSEPSVSSIAKLNATLPSSLLNLQTS